MKPLTDKTIEAAKAGNTRFSIYDNRLEGLQVIVYPTGVKSWVWRGKVAGKTQKHTLGRYPAHGLADAREWAAELIRKRNGGIDPRADKLASEATQAQRTMTLNRAFELYMQREGNQLKSAKEIRRYYERDIAPQLGNKAVTEITHDDLADIIAAKFEGAPTASNRLHSLIYRIFRWCVTKGRRDTRLTENPAQYLVKLFNEKSRDRVLDDYEISLLWRTIQGIDQKFSSALKLLILTGARRSEVLSARWDEFDLAKGEWLIPGVRTKNGKPLLLPLGPVALGVIQNLPSIDSSPLLFPSIRPSSNKSVSGVSKVLNRVRSQMIEMASQDGRQVEHWRLHDIRRSVATGISGLQSPQVQPHIVEALLNHISGSRSGVAGVYNRHAYYNEKKYALSLWEDHIISLNY